MSDAAKTAINARIGTNSRQGIEAGSAEGKAPRKRLRKLDKKIGKLEAKIALLRAERDRLDRSRLSAGHGQAPESSR